MVILRNEYRFLIRIKIIKKIIDIVPEVLITQMILVTTLQKK